MRKKVLAGLILILAVCLPAVVALADGTFKPSDATGPQTLLATALVFISGVVFLLVCVLLFLRVSHGTAAEDLKTWPTLLLVIALAVVMRAIAAVVFTGYSTDIACFKGWAIAAYENGPANFYTSGMFADYPPGYMSVLWTLGFIRNVFNIDASGALFTLIIKLPSILAEVGTALLAYKIASQRADPTVGLLCASAILFNPAMFFNSSVWGQIDAVLTLFIVLTLWFLVNKKYIPAAAMYALAVVFKPQAIMFAPVVGLAYLYAAITWVFKDKKRAWLFVSGVIIAAVPLVVLITQGLGLGLVGELASFVVSVYLTLPSVAQLVIALGFTVAPIVLIFMSVGIKRLAYGLACLLAAAAVFAAFIAPFSPVMPDTGYVLENADDRIIVELEGSHEIDSVKYYAEGEGSFSLTYSDDGESYYDVMFQPVDEDGTPEGEEQKLTVTLGSETDGKWQEVSLKELTAKYIAITVETPGANVGEIGLCDSNGNPLTVLQVTNAEDEASNTAGYMFDEQEYIPNEIIDPTFWVVDKYADAIGYYHYASINAFNAYTMFGLNWGTIPTFTLFGMDIAWGTVALVVICVGIVILQWRSRERRPFFDIAAFLVISVFMLMHGMHERYMIPACVCLIFAYIYSRDSVTLCFAAAFSIYALLNEMLTLYASSVVAPETPTLILSVVGVAMYLVYAVVTVRKLWSRKVLIKTPAMQG